ncbi:MAG: hypothetical protein LAO79_26630 [Acidobacteriia bacterium]|nr:hypothetical protein [Terriglobia bacterium]
MRFAWTALALSVSTVSAGPILFSIGGNDFGQPVRVTSIDVGASTATPLFDLQSDTAGFSGLTYRALDNLFFAVEFDGTDSTLVSISPGGGGAFSPVMTLVDPSSLVPLAFNGGLVYDPNDGYFYAMANDSQGRSNLYRIDSVGMTVQRLTTELPFSFNGGITLNPDGTIDAIRNDADGNSIVYKFTLSTNSAALSLLFGSSIGTGFYGGLAFGDDSNFYALGSDIFGAAAIDTINDGNANGLFGVGNGFLNAGLTEGPSAAPEPSTLMLAAGALAILCGFQKFRRKQ